MSTSREQNLKGKVALVTGSSRGIGAAAVIRLAEHGADVVINYFSSPKPAEEVAKKCQSLGVRTLVIQADVSKRQDLVKLFEQTIKEFGRLDIVFSNAGIEHFGKPDEVEEEQIDKVFNVNVKSQFFVAQQAYKHMNDNGRLILISSISAQMGFPGHSIYGASKAAIQGMIRSLAYDFGPRNITVNCVAPGGIKTDMYTEVAAKYIPGGDKMTEEQIDKFVSAWSPLGRPGFPDDVSGVIALLASPESQWITGQTLQVGGGAHMS
jgi:NAD(P)-dependent dehydrogenase (short-subunit alcohol dehydrogenase family)